MLQKLFAGFWKKTPAPDVPIKKPLIPPEGLALDAPIAFGFKCNWLAVSTSDTQGLATAFGLTEPTPCNWEYGIHYAYEGKFFVSPPVDGWTFIVSRNLPHAENSQNVELLKAMLIALSTQFGQAQYFGSLRTVSYDAWFKSENGRILRAYAIVDGSNIIVEGEPTDAEKSYNLFNSFSEECVNDPDYFERQDIDFPDESMTMEIAGAWSIDPQVLAELTTPSTTLGILGS